MKYTYQQVVWLLENDIYSVESRKLYCAAFNSRFNLQKNDEQLNLGRLQKYTYQPSKRVLELQLQYYKLNFYDSKASCATAEETVLATQLESEESEPTPEPTPEPITTSKSTTSKSTTSKSKSKSKLLPPSVDVSEIDDCLIQSPFRHHDTFHHMFYRRRLSRVALFKQLFTAVTTSDRAAYKKYTTAVGAKSQKLKVIQYNRSDFIQYHELTFFKPQRYISDNLINAMWFLFERHLLYYHGRCRTPSSSVPMCINSSYIWDGMRGLSEVEEEEDTSRKRPIRKVNKVTKYEVDYDNNFEVYRQSVDNDVWTKEVVFIPYNINQTHWILFVLDFTTYEYDVWDSLYYTFSEDHDDCWSCIEIYFQLKYKCDHKVDCPFKFTKAKVSYGPGPQQPEKSNDCALYCLFNMYWYAFRLHEANPNPSIPDISAGEYQTLMLEASNNRTLRIRALMILLQGHVFY